MLETHSKAARVVASERGVYVDAGAEYHYPTEAVVQIDMDMADAGTPLSEATAARVHWSATTGSEFRQHLEHVRVLDDGWLRTWLGDADAGWTLADYPPHAYVQIRWEPDA